MQIKIIAPYSSISKIAASNVWFWDSIVRTRMTWQRFADTVDTDPDDTAAHIDGHSRAAISSGIFRRNCAAPAKHDWPDSPLSCKSMCTLVECQPDDNRSGISGNSISAPCYVRSARTRHRYDSNWPRRFVVAAFGPYCRWPNVECTPNERNYNKNRMTKSTAVKKRNQLYVLYNKEEWGGGHLRNLFGEQLRCKSDTLPCPIGIRSQGIVAFCAVRSCRPHNLWKRNRATSRWPTLRPNSIRTRRRQSAFWPLPNVCFGLLEIFSLHLSSLSLMSPCWQLMWLWHFLSISFWVVLVLADAY